MDLDAGNLSGGKVQIWTCYAGNPNQVWTLS
jgi:hypothetical protein